jgi:hypothetical protein
MECNVMEWNVMELMECYGMLWNVMEWNVM